MSPENLDWEKAIKHFERTRQSYLDLQGMPGVNVNLALNFVFQPLMVRLHDGERTQELFDEIMELE